MQLSKQANCNGYSQRADRAVLITLHTGTGCTNLHTYSDSHRRYALHRQSDHGFIHAGGDLGLAHRGVTCRRFAVVGPRC